MSSFLPLALLRRRLHSLERRCLNDAAPSSLAQLIASRANHVLLSGRCPLSSYCPLPISLLNLPSSARLDLLSVTLDVPGEKKYHFQPRLFGKTRNAATLVAPAIAAGLGDTYIGHSRPCDRSKWICYSYSCNRYRNCCR
ncbi:uncharacterized protein LOC114259445 isoform X2 [Camellia sinensis]|uniref:uncharacterized protein LOC114259445 isoform X2 n=1 Tax=Camellia sinensis TaxID=4442 RepID=UPI00103638DA|nr:uncharacterized protein LOC114259445 isoform X2 [Camellia sinensis]